jgi:glycosyltransferase involved in cell wall biosynthesis
MLLIAARLAPEKGLLQFLSSLEHIDPALREKLVVCIAGTGPLLPELQQWTATRSVAVWLLGHQSESEMVELYAQADGFCLPSISDPNPLSVIEAIWAGLPLLLSSRVGNHPECLQDGKNGFLFDVFDQSSTTSAISRWLELSPKELSAFGNRSSQIAHEKFDPDQVIEAFLNELIPPVRDPEPLPNEPALQQLSSASSPKFSPRATVDEASFGRTSLQARH